MTENRIANMAVEAMYQAHKELGPGLFESVYEACLIHVLRLSGLVVMSQQKLPVIYKGINLDLGFRIDLLIENKVIIEIKSVEELHDVHLAQTITYLKLSGCKLGLLVNFNVPLIKQGIRRVVNGL